MNQTAWQRYKQLELIPDTVADPESSSFRLMAPLSLGWRLLINALVREHLCEQRTEYWERCWAIDYTPADPETAHSLHRLWELMN
jgi:hypothetical protein